MNSIVTDPKIGGYIATIMGALFLVGVVAAEQFENLETFYNTTPDNVATSNQRYSGPNPDLPANKQNISLRSAGDQLLAYQLYQQAVNAATPTMEQLNSISGQSQEQTDPQAVELGGGLSERTAPYDILKGDIYNSEFQAVNFPNERAQRISACAQNAPTFVATSLLPSPSIPGQPSWDVNAPENVLANQNFLSATQQIGLDTTLGSTRNQSYDIRNNIPNPINVVSPWQQSVIMPDLEKKSLDTWIPKGGLYGCADGSCNINSKYVGK